jgi:RHS repeat-associated protein
LGSSTTAETDTYYDSYGRPIRTATQGDSSHWYVVDTCYDAASRVHFQSYPYTATSLGAEVCSGAGDTYTYDALGRTLSVWDGSGNLISAQYYAAGQPFAYYLASDGHVRFQHQDWLGTERFRTTYTGTVEGSFTSLPFGDSTSTASGSDTDAYHYAGTDADTTDLQHATFRQYSAIQARWLRPDPYDGSYHFGNPQSFNRYAYTKNNPLSRTDASGLDDGSEDDGNPCDSEQDCEQRDDPIWATEGGGGGGDPDDGGYGISLMPSDVINLPSYNFAFKVDASLFDWISLLNYSNLSANFFLQAAGGAPSNGQVPVHGPWTYGNFCGAGGMGTPINGTDAACQQHDACYSQAGFSPGSNYQGSNAQLQACNQQLCNAVRASNRALIQQANPLVQHTSRGSSPMGAFTPAQAAQFQANSDINLFFTWLVAPGNSCHLP